MSKKIEKICVNCGYIFTVYERGIDRGKYCSKRCSSAYRTLDPIKRFRSNITIDESSGCWIYKTQGKIGYGNIVIKGITISTHRYSYEIAYGKIPEGMLVLHKCDCRACCNPTHLFLGTHLDNSRDKMAKGRANNAKGSSHGKAKLNESNVREIKLKLLMGESSKEIGKEFGIVSTAIDKIKNGSNWRHVILNK